jgi:hypothetical protein
MLVVIEAANLRNIEREIVNAAREAADLSGKRILVPTIDARRLRQAAKLAISMAISEDIWDHSETLNIPAPKRQFGVVNYEET